MDDINKKIQMSGIEIIKVFKFLHAVVGCDNDVTKKWFNSDSVKINKMIDEVDVTQGIDQPLFNFFIQSGQ